LLAALAERGHRILFLERDQSWYADNRDLVRPEFCRLGLYRSLAELQRWHADIADADAVVVGSYVPQGTAVARHVLETARGLTAFYDIDTPVTLARLKARDCEYMTPALLPKFDLYLSFTSGPALAHIEEEYGVKAARPLYCSVDPSVYRRTRAKRRWHLGYLGTYSADRQPALERLMLAAARRLPQLRFVVAGAQYPKTVAWPANVERIEHLPPAAHADFYSSLGWTLNLTRADMVTLGHSPSVRLFEASACATPIISDHWAGLDEIFRPDREIVVARSKEDVIAALMTGETTRRAIGNAARRRTLADHSAMHRAAEFERHLAEAAERRRSVSVPNRQAASDIGREPVISDSLPDLS
jgi:spore maturation protein CgeB